MKNKGDLKNKTVIAIMVVLLVVSLAFLGIYLFSGGLPTAPRQNDADLTVSETDIVSGSDISSADLSVTDISPTDEPIVEPEPIPEPDTATIQLTGDILVHEKVYSYASTGKSSYNFTPYFSMLGDLFQADLSIGNLETPVNARYSNSKISGYPVFNAPAELLPALAEAGFDALVTSNNHSVDMGYSGLKRTIEELDAAGLGHIGTYLDEAEAEQPIIYEINGIKIGFAAFASYNNGSIYSYRNFCIKLCGKTKSSMLTAIKPEIDKLKDAGAEFIIVSIHWGTEYADEPTADQKEVARQLCEYGADVIMGSHSHCVQPAEYIPVERNGETRQALVLYSLGNFFADQNNSKYGKKVQQGVVFSLKLMRGEDGTVRLHDCFYTPTFAYVKGSKNTNYMRVMPAGQYALAAERHSFFKNDNAWQLCKDAYTRVQKMIGGDFVCVPGPDSYPEGFFAQPEEAEAADTQADTTGTETAGTETTGTTE